MILRYIQKFFMSESEILEFSISNSKTRWCIDLTSNYQYSQKNLMPAPHHKCTVGDNAIAITATGHCFCQEVAIQTHRIWLPLSGFTVVPTYRNRLSGAIKTNHKEGGGGTTIPHVIISVEYIVFSLDLFKGVVVQKVDSRLLFLFVCICIPWVH